MGEDQIFLFFATMLMTFARVVGMFVQAPIWGSRHINTQVKIGFMATYTIIIWPYIPIPREMPGGPITFILLMVTQIAVGLVIGYVAFLPMAMAQFGGEIMDIQMGLSSAAAHDPSSKGTINLIRRFKFYIAMLFFMIVDAHHELIKITAKSFDVVPLTGARFSGMLIHDLIQWTGELFLVGVQIALPVMGALFVIQVALGIMARVAPQMNVFMLSFPLNILTGLVILNAALPFFVHRLAEIFHRNQNWIMTALYHLKPN